MERLTQWNENKELLVREEERLLNANGLITKDEMYKIMRHLAEKLVKYEDAEEQGLLLRLPCKVENLIDKVISHNEVVALWFEVVAGDKAYDELIWKGMAWGIPEAYKQCEVVKIFGSIQESIYETDIINIRIKLTKEEAEAKLKEMECGNNDQKAKEK